MPITLFYYYGDLQEPASSLAEFVRELCVTQSLSGRIRISGEGINGTAGGTEEGISKLEHGLLERLGNPSIDFKRSKGSKGDFPSGLTVRVCAELVTIGVDPEEASWRDAAPHLSPETFLKEARNNQGDVVLLDCRNSYEHAIGHFSRAIRPNIRQFSDFPGYMNENSEQFRGKRVLMYCTGGIRCERASAFVKGMDIAKSVAQLEGGIHRFLDRFPDGGGMFLGKNLVFDARMAMASENPEIVGRCVVCNGKWDDYSAGWRCKYCRARVLLCANEDCQKSFFSGHGKGMCALCIDQGREIEREQSSGPN